MERNTAFQRRIRMMEGMGISPPIALRAARLFPWDMKQAVMWATAEALLDCHARSSDGYMFREDFVTSRP